MANVAGMCEKSLSKLLPLHSTKHFHHLELSTRSLRLTFQCDLIINRFYQLVQCLYHP